jgi:hypothetical protein
MKYLMALGTCEMKSSLVGNSDLSSVTVCCEKYLNAKCVTFCSVTQVYTCVSEVMADNPGTVFILSFTCVMTIFQFSGTNPRRIVSRTPLNAECSQS